MQSDQEHYDSMTSRLLCAVIYNPTEHEEFQWTIYSRHTSADETSKPEPIDDEHAVVFDLRSKEWLQIIKEHVIRIEFPYFTECCLTDPEALPFRDTYIAGATGDVMDPITPMNLDVQPITGVETTRHIATPLEYCESPNKYTGTFDAVTYEEDVKELIDEFEDDEDEPWLGNFTPIPSIVKWREVMEYLYEGSSADLLNDELDMSKVAADWSELIDAKKVEALEFLETEKRELLVEIKEEPDNAEDYQEEVEEIEVIVNLINEQVKEYKQLATKCSDIYEIVDNWPPILLPMPFKFNAIDPSQDPTFSDKYDEE